MRASHFNDNVMLRVNTKFHYRIRYVGAATLLHPGVSMASRISSSLLLSCGATHVITYAAPLLIAKLDLFAGCCPQFTGLGGDGDAAPCITACAERMEGAHARAVRQQRHVVGFLVGKAILSNAAAVRFSP